MLFYLKIFQKFSECLYGFLQESDIYKKNDKVRFFPYFKYFLTKTSKIILNVVIRFLLGIVRSISSWLQMQKDNESQDGGGIGRGDHFLFYKFIERTTER